ncbi:RNA polymerase sigma factor [Eubacterium callanderi]|uniref:RNA polymerase sigma factor n=1 Tax=Eubacterium callanderi TaxID=53442 RepID=UPI001C10893A|nr:sigma-70 family RNA polymerase sigma factor [Eubacterium callanderi]MBU5305054.1 sigma-70 family RNA polymerase sigma factor [Eubacterium callanderi]
MKQNDDSEDYTGLERLVKKAKAGDQQAKEKLIFAFQPLILTTIQKYVYDQKEYEDAYQDAVCVFLEALRDFELEARVYFQVFIRSRLTNYFKKRREGRFERSIKPEESLDRQIEGEGGAIALIELIIDEKTDVAEAYLQKEKNQRLVQVYEKLPPRQKAAFQYFYQQKGDLTELAKEEGVNPSMMTRACRSAFRKLREFR